MTVLFGGVFDPPHVGHVALARAVLERFDPRRLVILVVERPGHKPVVARVEDRLRLARIAFGGLPRTEVELEREPFTVDALRHRDEDDLLFVVGADELAGFLTWKDPEGVLDRVRLAVATRPGSPSPGLDAVLAELGRPDRVELFSIPELPVSSTDIRSRIANGEPIDELVPAAVAREIEGSGLYR